MEPELVNMVGVIVKWSVIVTIILSFIAGTMLIMLIAMSRIFAYTFKWVMIGGLITLGICISIYIIKRIKGESVDTEVVKIKNIMEKFSI